MAERSIEDAGLTGTLAEELLTRRTEEIEQMQTLARTGKCFRNSLEDVFTGGQRPRRQLWKNDSYSGRLPKAGGPLSAVLLRLLR